PPYRNLVPLLVALPLWNSPFSSRTKAKPPLMPPAKLRPVGPRITAAPPVMYSQPWSPTPSTTAMAPELRTQNRSPATPRRYSSRSEEHTSELQSRENLV